MNKHAYVLLGSENIMDGLTLAIRRCNLKLKLDNLTEGFGNCFPHAIVQQCRRPEVRKWLHDHNPNALFNGQEHVRREVTNFALKSRHVEITRLKTQHKNEIHARKVSHLTWMIFSRLDLK